MERVLFGVAALAVCLAAAGCASDGGDGMSSGLVRAASVSGDAASAAGEEGAAAALYERAWKADPSVSVGVRWGRALRQAGDPKAATLAMQEVTRRFPSDAAGLTELGRCAMAGGYTSEATAAFSGAVAARGAGWATFMANGAFLAGQVRDADAEASFRTAGADARSGTERYSALANLAMLKAQRGDLRGGLADMQAIAAHPDAAPKVQADLALLYGLSGDRAGFAHAAQQAMLPPEEVEQVGRWLEGTDGGDAAPRHRAR